MHAGGVRLVSFRLWLLTVTACALVACAGEEPPPPPPPSPSPASVLEGNAPTDAKLKAIEEIRSAGPRSVRTALPALIKSLQPEDQAVAAAAGAAIGSLGDDSVRVLAAVVADPRRKAIGLRALRDVSVISSSAMPQVASAPSSGAMTAIEVAGALATKNAIAITPLREALKHEDINVRIRAATELAALGSRSAPAISDLLSALDDTSPAVQEEACAALVSIGPAATVALPKLRELESHSSPHIHAVAQRAAALLEAHASGTASPSP